MTRSPSSGRSARRPGSGRYLPINTFYAPGGSKTDYSYAIDQLQATHPECTTVSLVCSWFFNSEDAVDVQIYPSTNYPARRGLGGRKRSLPVDADIGWFRA